MAKTETNRIFLVAELDAFLHDHFFLQQILQQFIHFGIGFIGKMTIKMVAAFCRFKTYLLPIFGSEPRLQFVGALFQSRNDDRKMLVISLAK